jgi:PAS domain S-box-containing protein
MAKKAVKSISMDGSFYTKIRRHAKKRHMSASGWLAVAAEEKLAREKALIVSDSEPPYRVTEDAIVTTDPDGRITTINRAFSQMCGYSSKELIGKKPGELLQGAATEKDVIRDFRKAIKAVKPFTCMLSNYHKNGSLYHVHIAMRPLFHGKTLTGFEALEKRLD